MTTGGHLEFRCLGSSKYKKWYQEINTYCWKRVSRVEVSRSYGLYGSKQKKMKFGRWQPSWILIFRLIKIQNLCQKWALYAVGKVILHRFLWPFTFSYIFNMAAGGHLEFWWLDWSKYKNDARNGFSMPKWVGKVVYTAFEVNWFSSYISNVAVGSHFGFWLLTNSAAIFARVMGAQFL